MNITEREAHLLYKYADKELYEIHDGGTLVDIFYIVCPCCGYHDVEEAYLDNVSNGAVTLEDLIQHSPNCEFEEYKLVLEKLKDFIS